MNEAQYERLSAPFRKNPARVRMLQLATRTIELLFYLAYPVLFAALMIAGPETGDSFPLNTLILPSLAIPAAGFALISLMRKSINAPRPYEALSIDPLIKKETQGQSFPSKHAFSSLMIAMCWLRFSPVVGLPLIVAAACLAVARVIGGVHFPKDVIAGCAIALCLGCLLFMW